MTSTAKNRIAGHYRGVDEREGDDDDDDDGGDDYGLQRHADVRRCLWSTVRQPSDLDASIARASKVLGGLWEKRGTNTFLVICSLKLVCTWQAD